MLKQQAVMRSIGVSETGAVLPKLERLLAEEGELLITRNGKPVARLMPPVHGKGIPCHAELRSRIQRLEVGSEALIREDRDARG
jgi:antitoxin (DNA-binding transcriptional repressor) of toxin-antitoxin stability system